jgi:signal transduction histidine kinase
MGKSAKKLTLLSPNQKKQKFNTSRQDNRIRLPDFINKTTEQIVSEWESFARTLKPAANDMTPLALRNHIHEILSFIVSDINSPQNYLQQVQKSQGRKKKTSAVTAAQTHAALRLAGGFDIDQMVSEYRALRASVIRLWSKANKSMDDRDIIDLIRFNEAVDQELAESVSHYTQKVSYSKDLFMGILGHDIRNPLNAVSISAQLILNMEAASEQQITNKRQVMLATQIFESASRINEIVANLIDVTHARFGSGLPIVRAPMDFGFVSRLLVDEMRRAYPTHTITLEVSGNLEGEWDKARIGQVFSNLIGNAIQYSFQDSPIEVIVKGVAKEVLLSVHNIGVPIPFEKINTLFNALTRAGADGEAHSGAFNLGLGLYITNDIVVSHGGTIDITSSEKEGTTFTARFPRSV